ncbi:MAG TPA: Tad domain-containing protein [Symbiobacteriaceae bacterium]|nr:Tad domain-containing protein [Symbiobacteriaceae bacterium]
MLHRLGHVKREEKGSVAVIVAMGLTAMLGLAALGTDVGRMYLERQRLHSVVDAAVLAGAQHLPSNPTAAVAEAREYLQKNQYDPNRAVITLSDDQHSMNIAVDGNVTMTFARVVGFDEVDVRAEAGAYTANLSGAYGAVPLGVPRADWQIGQQVTLKLDADSGTIAPGNYMALALGRSGSSAYENNLANGYQGWLRMGQWIETETGNMATPTVRGIGTRILQDPTSTYLTATRQSPRLVVVPILQDYNVNGRGEVLIVGFAMFFVEGVEDHGNDKGEITGRFVRMIAEGEHSATAPDFGVHVTKLVR